MMCAICGCGESGYTTGQGLLAPHFHSHSPAPSPSVRIINLEQNILRENQIHADANRAYFAQRDIFALNLVSSPGSGKTTLLTQTLHAQQPNASVYVIEGDQQTDRDAARIRATGIPVVQINTGKGCHLEARGVGHAVEQLNIAEGGVLFIENVGNLVCPAGFDLGERHKVVVLSVTEGDDKPLKYPDMFRAARVMVINKIDLLPYVDFNLAQCLAYAQRVNPTIASISLSARTGEGMDRWYAWLARERAVSTPPVLPISNSVGV